MTNEEIISNYKYDRAIIFIRRIKTEETHERCIDRHKAFDLAIEALEKQIPKHIEEQTEEDREFIDYVCPNCKTTLQQKMKGATRTTIYKYKHCIFCGQSLDWNDHPTEKGGEG